MVKDKFSDSNNYVEIKLFPGLKVTSRFIPSEQSVSKRLNINPYNISRCVSGKLKSYKGYIWKLE